MTQDKIKSLLDKGLLKQEIFMNGKWTSADTAEVIEVTNPATNETIGTIPNATEIETKRAIESANKAFETWSQSTVNERANFLNKMANITQENLEDFATLLTIEQGKPLAEARKEIESGIRYIRWFAEEARRINGQILPSPWADRQIFIMREAVGVVGAITPWNFPFSMLARKIAPALAAGCTVVAKPSELTPYCGLLWGVLAEKAGLPNGVINVVTGHSKAIGRELTNNSKVRKLTFTGSTTVGKLLYGQSAETMKKISMELGGNAPFIVFEDANLDKAIEGAIAAKYRNAGQTCICVNRFYIHEKIYDEFAKRFIKRVQEMKIGNGLDEGVEITPLINQAALEKAERHIKDAIEKSGTIACGGKRHKLGGTYFEPTVIVNANQNMLIAEEEVFAPVAALFKFSSEEEVITTANNTEYGLASYFYTQNLARTFRVSKALQTGMVGINAGLITTEIAPFGGVKESGIGSEGGMQGINEYLNIKYVSLGGL